MKILLPVILLAGISAFAQQQQERPKDTVIYEFRPRYYLNQDSTKVRERIEKDIEQQRKKAREKQKTKTVFYWNTGIACRYEKIKPQDSGAFVGCWSF